MEDHIRDEINSSHRFNSFADQRYENFVKWYFVACFVNELKLTLTRHVDGHDYMYAVSEMLESAKEAIFILVCVIKSLRFLY